MYLLAQSIAKQMIERGIKGRIINISSVSAISGSKTQVHYCAAKAAVNAFTKSVAIALGKHGITVNAVLPGPIPTKHNRDVLDDEKIRDGLFDRMPLGRYGCPENIAEAVLYFASENAEWTTGSLLIVDGGYMTK